MSSCRICGKPQWTLDTSPGAGGTLCKADASSDCDGTYVNWRARALEAWLPKLARRPNPRGLVWPATTGEQRCEGAPSAWESWQLLAGLEPSTRHDGRHVRWHDLRHTCASSLVAGWWGRRWTLEEVRALLGHSSVTVTERYAHLAGSVIDEAARGTIVVPRIRRESSKTLRPRQDSDLRTFGLGMPPEVSRDAEMAALRGQIVGRAVDGLRSLARGGPGAVREATAALAAIVTLAEPSAATSTPHAKGGAA